LHLWKIINLYEPGIKEQEIQEVQIRQNERDGKRHREVYSKGKEERKAREREGIFF
jgi:hypothetical protein